MAPRPCLLCGTPSTSTRCPKCEATYQQARRPNFRQRGYDAEYERIRKTLLGRPCHWCGAPATTADHLIPISKGGGNQHLVPSCAPCNYGRGNRTE